MNTDIFTRTPSEYPPLVSVVVIGRNEGQRLTRCLQSVAGMTREDFELEVIYVDSASTDGSPDNAATLGARVITLESAHPSAARGRNAGWRAARGEFVLFLDGDTIVHPAFVSTALMVMRAPDVAIVWGHRRELHPEHSIYNRVLDLDWTYPPGRTAFCGGDALMRVSMLQVVDGFDASLIAGEEPDLCRRIRALGGIIQHIDAPMTGHDLAITRFAAYWKRAYRAGHAYAEIASRYRHSPDPLWLRDSRRNLLHASSLALTLGMLPLSLAWPASTLLLLAMLLVLIGRTFLRCRWKSADRRTRLLYSLHAHLQQLPIALGQVSYFLNVQRGQRSRLIEYKHNTRA